MEPLHPDLIKIFINGGISVVLYTIWYITYSRSVKQHKELLAHLFQIMQADAHHKEALHLLLQRIEIKIDLLARERGVK